MKEKKNITEETMKNDDGMISSSIFDDMFGQPIPNEEGTFEDEAEVEESLLSNDEEKEPEQKLTIESVFGSSEEPSTNEGEPQEDEVTIYEEEEDSSTVTEEAETPISDIQEKLPPITITEEEEDGEQVVLKPISSLQEQLPPITIADDSANADGSQESLNLDTSKISTSIDPIFDKWKKEREEAKLQDQNQEQSEGPREETEIIEEPREEIHTEEENIQIGVTEEAETSPSEELAMANPFEENKVEANDIPNDEHEIDYFNYDFSEEVEQQVAPNNSSSNNNENLTDAGLQFDFYNTIRPRENEQEKLPTEERIEFSKIFDKKESNNDDEQIITINEESGNEYRRNKQITKYSLYAFYVFLVIFAIGLVIFLINKKSHFSLTRDEITLALRSTYQAEVVANTKIQENDKYEWSTSNAEIATVNENGVITAINKGTATITVKSKKSRKSQTLLVTAVDITINSIRFEKQKITITEGDELTLSPIINEDETIVMNLEWTSWNENVVTVDQNGHIIAKGPGETSISVIDPESNVGTEIIISVKAKVRPSNTDKNTNSNSNSNKYH